MAGECSRHASHSCYTLSYRVSCQLLSETFVQRDEVDEDDDEDEEETRPTLFCRGALGALCSAIHHLHPYETTSERKELESRKRQGHRQRMLGSRGIPSSEMNARVTGAGNVVAGSAGDEEDDEMIVDQHASVAPRQQQPASPSGDPPLDNPFHDAHAASLVSEDLSGPTSLSSILATLRGTRPPVSAMPTAASPPPSQAPQNIPSSANTSPRPRIEPERRRLHALPATTAKGYKYVQCMSCVEEEWLRVPVAAKYVRCPTCSSITIALASNSRFPARQGRREQGNPCTRLWARLFSRRSMHL